MNSKRIHRIILIAACGIMLTSCQHKMYLFTSFREPANEGLRMLYSKDGYHWNRFDTVFLKPMVGKEKIMRDPSMIQGPDGVFHLVWTTEWKGNNGFGYASSKDLVHWSEEQYIPVMQHEPTAVNVWAPELFYDAAAKQYLIVWASCIPGRFAKGQEEENNNHRLYYTTTKDFINFTEAKLFLDPGFSSIDAVIVKRGDYDHVLVFKDNTRPERDIKLAFSSGPLGPYTEVSQSVSANFCEGPAVAKVKDGWLIYYDAYREKKFGALFTTDFKTFRQADSLVSVPQGHKHGTILQVKKNIVQKLIAYSGK